MNVDRVVCGSLMTSLEMAGVSLTLLKMEPGWDKCLGMIVYYRSTVTVPPVKDKILSV